MNIITKSISPLIRIGYWSDINRFYKISSPLLIFYKGDDIEVYVVMAEYRDPGLDLDPIPIDITGTEIKVDISNSSWAEDEPILQYTESNKKVVKVNPVKGYFKFIISKEDSTLLNLGPHLFKVFFIKDGLQTRALQDMFEILE